MSGFISFSRWREEEEEEETYSVLIHDVQNEGDLPSIRTEVEEDETSDLHSVITLHL